MAKYDLETTTVGELLDDPQAVAIVDELAPGVTSHPMIGFAKGMPLAAVLKLAGGQIDPAALEQLKSRIAAL
ncbi:MAG: hypothetical protein ABW024_08860 [Microbacterium sp.]